MDKKPQYNHAGMGGTFDRLHKGHHTLIGSALSHSGKVTIGLTVDDYSNHKTFHQIIHPYSDRQAQLEKYLADTGTADRVSIVPLKDIYGPTISDSTIDCLVVTDHTYKGAEEINNKRKDMGFLDLPIIKAELIKDDEGEYLSSTRIRQGEINRQGEIYKKYISKQVVLNPGQKNSLKEPQGNIVHGPDDLKDLISNISPTYISLVGDITLSFFLENKLPFNMGFFRWKNSKTSK